MLSEFYTAQVHEVSRLQSLAAGDALPPVYRGLRPSLAKALRASAPGRVIAEYKRASPSRGALNLSLEPERAAEIYARGGAAALSVLTEKAHFQGDIAYLQRMTGPGLPLLRKDFLIDPLQVRETAATPASALLLIVRMLSEPVLAAMLAATGKYGLEAVIEIFNLDDLRRARAALSKTQAGPAIIQINNRDLATLRVNPELSAELIGNRQGSEIWISASGAENACAVRQRAALGYDAVLIGSALMAAADPGAALAAITGGTANAPAC